MPGKGGGNKKGLSKKFAQLGTSSSAQGPGPSGLNNHGGSDSEDAESAAEGNPGFKLGPRQDPRERRKIRQTYSELRELTQANRHDLTKPSSTGLHHTLEQTEEIFKNVREPREAAMDSGMIALISHLTRQQAQALHTDFVTFEPTEFAAKMKTLISGSEFTEADRERTRISKDGWIKLGEAAQPFFKRSPTLHCMFGTFEKGPPKKKQPNQRAKPMKDKDSEKGPIKPTELKTFNSTNEEVTTVEVERMYQILSSTYQKMGRRPLCYFEFVVNPHSFSLTVENIFYASFLVRDGHARVFLDDEKLPVIEPVEKGNDESGLSRLPRHQVIISITVEEWENIVKTFQITEPLIKPRNTDPKLTTSADENRRPPGEGGKKPKH